MEWIVLAVAYLVIGVGVVAWSVHSNKMLDPDQKKRSAKVMILFPELCLFWPVALFLKIKRRRASGQIANNHID
jgi:hypothetical protein